MADTDRMVNTMVLVWMEISVIVEMHFEFLSELEHK